MESQNSPIDREPLIYMHSHDPDNPITNLCKDPSCSLNNPPSVSVNTKLQEYLNNLEIPSEPVHPDMYNIEIASEVGVESSISQQDNYIRTLKRYKENGQSELEKIKMELRMELEGQIRAELEAKIKRADNQSTDHTATNELEMGRYDQLRQMQNDFDEKAYNLRLSQARERHAFQQEHFQKISLMQMEHASLKDISIVKETYSYELLELESRFKRERKSLDDQAFSSLCAIVDSQRTRKSTRNQ
ncbi:hypothetical protein HK103_001508 [Boothiomyces macroporosus]|uniref:Uncharacterized protein n=1 Tax=Boothiomyces macroporosus TaxID=261099 RepID=A0AAD5Y9V4_9FUNG|nr:hypothetical protein HK103_001508 [Boothiomyces macroporosus]